MLGCCVATATRVAWPVVVPSAMGHSEGVVGWRLTARFATRGGRSFLLIFQGEIPLLVLLYDTDHDFTEPLFPQEKASHSQESRIGEIL
jgi:hypothetical protein